MDGIRKRKNISSLLEGAKSVLSVGFTYISSQKNNNKSFKVGKFGQGEDYHKVIYKKLKNIGKWINHEIPDCRWKICVDTSHFLKKHGLKNLVLVGSAKIVT